MKFRSLLLGAICLASFAGSAAGAEQKPMPGGSLKIALRSDPGSYDCHATISSTPAMAIGPVYSTLLKIDAFHYPKIVGDLAQSWTISDDKLTYTFTLYPNVKFHDGSSLTSADVKASFDRIRHPPEGVISVRKALFADIKTIETPDPQTVVFTLSEPDPFMIVALAHPLNCIYSAALLAKDQTAPAREVIGSGPFKLVDRVPGTHIVYEKFPDYFRRGLPYLDRVEFVIVSPPAVVPSLIGGQVDADIFTFANSIVDRIKQARGNDIVFDTSTATTFNYVAINGKRKVFDDPRVRRALRLAIDLDSGEKNLQKLVSLNDHTPFFRPTNANVLPPEELGKMAGYGHDMQKAREEAKRLLKEAGATDLKLTLLGPDTSDPFASLAVFLIDNWRAIGVTVEFRPLTIAQYTQAKNNDDYDLALDWNAPVSDNPIEVLELFARPNRITFAGKPDEEIQKLYAALKKESDPTKAKDLAQAIQRRVLENNYALPTFWATRTTAMHREIHGWKTPPSFYLGNDFVELWRESKSN
jgi:peptide/nickel transport system substrate-binding protein